MLEWRIGVATLNKSSTTAQATGCPLCRPTTLTTMDEANRPTDLIRALEAIRRTQGVWLKDLEAVCAGDPRFLDAFRRWQEWLLMIRLHLARAESKLLHFLMVPAERRPWQDLPGQRPTPRQVHGQWEKLVPPYLHALRIDTTYRRLPSLIEGEDEPLRADIATDITELASIADASNQAMDRLLVHENGDTLENLAFYHVLSPWRTRGLAPLRDVLGWIEEFLIERGEL